MPTIKPCTNCNITHIICDCEIKRIQLDIRNKTVKSIFEWIKKHSVIKDTEGNIITDAYIDSGSVHLKEFMDKEFIKHTKKSKKAKK